MRKISVLLVDDHTVVRQGLRYLLCREPDIEVVGEAENGRQAVQMAAQLKPDIVVMDLAMPQLNGVEATRQIIADATPSKVLILSSYADGEYVEQLGEMGVSGYLVKQAAAEDLIRAVREISQGNAFFSPSISKTLLDFYRGNSVGGRPLAQRGEPLTSREQEILQLVAESRLNKEMAGALNLSIKTVEKHRQSLMNKLNIHDIAGLTRYAIEQGIVESKGRMAKLPLPPEVTEAGLIGESVGVPESSRMPDWG
jgi:DNA-binding NarL/FixJ family response regulator